MVIPGSIPWRSFERPQSKNAPSHWLRANDSISPWYHLNLDTVIHTQFLITAGSPPPHTVSFRGRAWKPPSPSRRKTCTIRLLSAACKLGYSSSATLLRLHIIKNFIFSVKGILPLFSLFSRGNPSSFFGSFSCFLFFFSLLFWLFSGKLFKLQNHFVL